MAILDGAVLINTSALLGLVLFLQVDRLGTGSPLVRMRLSIRKGSCLRRDSISTLLILCFYPVTGAATAVLYSA